MRESLEAQRILRRYRRLILLGGAKLPLAAALKLVGPDTAYHLYFRHAGEPPDAPRPRRSRARR